MKNLYLILLFASIIACSSDEEKLPANVIKSSTGLTIDLEWTTGGSSTQAQTDVDLDMALKLGGAKIDGSEGSQFEEVQIEDFYADGDYIVQVLYYQGVVSTDYSLYVYGTGSTDNKVYESSFLSSDEGITVDYLKINKAGTTYTITDL